MEAKKFQTKDGGLVAMAESGVIQMGCNPFGFVCADCGTVHAIRYQVRNPEDGSLLAYELQAGNHEELLLDVEVTRDEVETVRYREHLGIPGPAQDVARELIAVDDLVLQALAVVLPSEEPMADTVEQRVGQLITILGMHREVLSNFRATMKNMMKGIEIARDAVRGELKDQRLTSAVRQSQWLLIADETLSSMVPELNKDEAPKIILPGGAHV